MRRSRRTPGCRHGHPVAVGTGDNRTDQSDALCEGHGDETHCDAGEGALSEGDAALQRCAGEFRVAQLVKIDGTTRRLWLQVAHAESLSEMSGLLRRISAAGDKSPSALIRKRLGLPKYDEKDYQ